MLLTNDIAKQTIQLRRTLHANPELSGKEKETAIRIKDFLAGQAPDAIIDNIGGYGIAALYDSGREGPTVLLRADLDALPIDEVNTFPYRSQTTGVSHKCGHDGHMAILAGLSMIIKTHRPKKGRLVLLFQPEEENGQGANKVINDNKFRSIQPDYAFALHNLPGYKKNGVVVKEGPFAAASKGLIVELKGQSSHAAHPEEGHSPVSMFCELIAGMNRLPDIGGQFRDFSLLTIIHARLGEVAFGTNPGKATVMATLRTFLNSDMTTLYTKAVELARDLGEKHGIKTHISTTEEFPATINDTQATEIIRNAVSLSSAATANITEPFRWSEDFGHFSPITKSALFGIGAGQDHPRLHNHDYDFPDDIIETGISMFYHIADQLVNVT